LKIPDTRNQTPTRTAKVQFVFTGFSQEVEFRVFAFERIGEGQIRTKFSVRTELALLRKYGIRLQELPLMCRGILERRDEGEVNFTTTFTEAEMSVYAKDLAAARQTAAEKRRRFSPPARTQEAPGEAPAKDTL
jgi:hypothetical protein